MSWTVSPRSHATIRLPRLAAHLSAGRSGHGQRAQFILWYASGKPRDEILAELNVSENSLRRWYTRWVDDGIDGLLHLGDSSIERVIKHVAQQDPEPAARIRRAVARVREFNPE